MEASSPIYPAPAQLDANARSRSAELRALTARWGEHYRIWFERGLWQAERDGTRLFGDSPAALDAILADHMSLLRTGRRP